MLSSFDVRCGLGIVGALLLSACRPDPSALTVPNPDLELFEVDVYPVLLRDCGFPECHGNEARFFRVYGPGRTRLQTSAAEVLPLDPATVGEITASYDRARSMLRGVHGVEDSPLLRKPLAVGAGGAGHRGADGWGRNVYARKNDPAYLILWNWALSLQESAHAQGEP